MLIGVMSDSHDKVEMVAAAVRLLQSRGAEFLIHCGDVGTARVLDHFAGIPSAFVWGNCDFDRYVLEQHGEFLGVRCLGSYGELELDGKRLAVLHGDDGRRKRQAIEGQAFDYVLYGHTHRDADVRVGRTRVLNPGALHRANPKTVMLIDTRQDSVELLTVGN